ncbi:acyl-CoA carboxylase subunit beta [Saccharopolyspora sp. NFXS83]|uniref:acyl-CoA carboxylase subunit beta n=1 Tax=Saccharopolyspora sp. NFXS83 TaxID=2993560 RepID=UPI002B060D88|nr:carboxyl transferase domain-containing protein [Saccharopolyspora sp. NFXS83]
MPGTATADPRDPWLRLGLLLDEESITPLHDRDHSGVRAVRGRIDGVPVIAYCTDGTKMGGAMGTEGCRHVVDAIDAAVRDGCPVIGVWHSGGARLAEGVEALDAVGQVFAAMIRASGRVPQLSVVVGPAAGGAAYGPALTDVVIMAPAGRVFITGPDVVRSVTGEQIDQEGLGGTEAHGTKSGVVHVVAEDEPDAYARARRLTGLFATPGSFDPASIADGSDLRALLPDRPQRAYDIKPVIRGVLDTRADGSADFEELQAKWAPNMVVGLGRLGGRAIGVLANNPLRKGGCLDSLSAEKAARFVRMCDAFGVPLLVVVDVPGYLPGVGQEWGGVVRRGAKLLHAFGEAVVPRVTLVLRKSFGGAYIAMNARSLGATAVFAWPEAEVAVMGAKAAVGVLHRKALAAAPDEEREALQDKLAEEHERAAGGVGRAMSIGVVDEVVEPAQTRRRVAEALAAAPANRGAHGNIPL